MVLQWLILSIFLNSVVSQYLVDTIMKPDVTFGDTNDRYDITSIIDEQKRFYNVDQDYRRKPDNFNNLKTKEDGVINALTDVFKSMRRTDTDFAYHDKMRSDENDNIGDFEENLEKLRKEGEKKKKFENIVSGLHDGEEVSGRRNQGADLENEVLLHYAFPVLMKVNGFLQVPLT